MIMAAELKQTPVISEELKNWVSTAASSGATDMHIEPYGEGLRVRLRVGGALVQPPFQSEAPEGAVDQLKAMAGLPLGKSLAPNSGIFSVDIDEDKMVSVRLTTFPTLRGDRLLLRFTSLEELASFDELGLNTDQIRTLSQTVSRRGGLTIVSGPWCSGEVCDAACHRQTTQPRRTPRCVDRRSDRAGNPWSDPDTGRRSQRYGLCLVASTRDAA